jgi:glycosyltransferase involved in cell wall biosynthesis
MGRPVPILFLFPALDVGGAERQLEALVRGLDRARFRPVVACQHGRGAVAVALEGAGVPVYQLSDNRRFDPGFPLRMLELLRREEIRLVASHGFSTGVVGRLAAGVAGVRVCVLLEHATGERDMSPLKHRINRLLAPRATAWVAVAAGQLDYLQRVKHIPASRIHVIRNGIDPAPYMFPAAERAALAARVRAELGIPTGAPVAGSLAVLRPEKDLHTFVRAARIAHASLPEARYIIVGDGPLRRDLEHEIDAVGLGDRVILAGWRADIPQVLAALDVSVLCSTDVETLPMAFLESMAAGLPLIGTRVGGLPELIDAERNGLLIPPRQPEALAAALVRVLRNLETARVWGRASRQRVEREFGLDRMVRGYEDLFARLLAAAGVPVPG